MRVACMGGKRNACRVLVGSPEEKRPVRRTRHTWEDNIKKDLKEIGLCGIDWIHMAQNRDKCQGSCEQSNEPSSSIKVEKFFSS